MCPRRLLVFDNICNFSVIRIDARHQRYQITRLYCDFIQARELGWDINSIWKDKCQGGKTEPGPRRYAYQCGPGLARISHQDDGPSLVL